MSWKPVPRRHPPDGRNTSLGNEGIWGGHLGNGTVIYVDIVKVFKEYFKN